MNKPKNNEVSNAKTMLYVKNGEWGQAVETKKEIDLIWNGESAIFIKYSQVPKAIVFISLWK